MEPSEKMWTWIKGTHKAGRFEVKATFTCWGSKSSFTSTTNFCCHRRSCQCPVNWDIRVDEGSERSHPFPRARLVSEFGKELAEISLQIPSPPPPLHEVTPKVLRAAGKRTVGLLEWNLQLKSWPFLAGGNAAQTSVRMGIHSLHPELQTLFVWLAPAAPAELSPCTRCQQWHRAGFAAAPCTRGKCGIRNSWWDEKGRAVPQPVRGHILGGQGREGTLISAGRDPPCGPTSAR